VRRKLQVLSVGTVAVLLVATSSFAHHAWAVDTSRSITVKGTVTGVDWSNPHVQIFVDTKDSNGNVEKWTVGGPSPSRMAGTGWNKDTLKAGDVITAVGQRATDAPNLMKTQKVVLSNGKELIAYGGN
jgi:Family of unknown function (DUF6152)